MKKIDALLIDYGDWLTSDLERLLAAEQLIVVKRFQLQRTLLLKTVRFLLRVGGPRPRFHDRRRLIEFALLDVWACMLLLLHRPLNYFCLKDQALFSLSLAKLIGIKTYCIFGNPRMAIDADMQCHARRVWEFLEAAEIRLSDHLICESGFAARELPGVKVLVINTLQCAAELTNFDHASRSRPKDFFLFVGTGRRKGEDLFLEIAELNPQFKFVHITNNANGSRLANIVELGHRARHEFIELLSSARALLVPSRSDGGPRVLFEALSVGTPVIASTRCAAPDLAQNPLVIIKEPEAVALSLSLREFSEPRHESRKEGVHRLAAQVLSQQTAMLRTLRRSRP